ncbi:epoxide hydrolase. Serine peptidase. MEROPS family S33 [Chromohalobacter canadensis]|uniref:Epoxide hydrolase. Serine peptidase. MEROPS family S33 n=1 Tax=Chromohalobacter canadensis TaxID=141389 RepID=A0A285VVZ7_9GAMM|nr:alpha/beta hydrolase [Chromohalobacter canadensis]SOC57758.1 epoxide hydrolase. Serine peptidase. MEROPS family S33 [Chromohalobacter canadensis]
MREPESLNLAHGRLAALAWGDADAPVWLALHGWLDNAESFSRLAPLLVERLGIRIVAIDFPGHGRSQPRAEGGDYPIWEYTLDVLDALDALGLDSAPLLAHSMGAAVSCLVAAAMPERVARLVLIDGLGTLTTEVDDTAKQLRMGLIQRRRSRSTVPRYPDEDTAIAVRVAGGVTPIDADTAAPLVRRNLDVEDDGHVRLRSDGRLLRPSLVRFTTEQMLSLLRTIEAPVLLIEGEQGILAERAYAQRARDAIARLTRLILPGGHHLHLEAHAVDAVAEAIVADSNETTRRHA